MSAEQFLDLSTLAQRLRKKLNKKKFVLLYAYNGTGKTRLSTAFKDLGKNGDNRDTASSPGWANWRWTPASARC